MSIDWGAAISRKYDILQQNANTAQREGFANAANADERTRLLGPSSQAAIGLQAAQSQNLGAQTAGLNNLNLVPTSDIIGGLLGRGFYASGNVGSGMRPTTIGAPVITSGFLSRPAGSTVMPEITTEGYRKILADDEAQNRSRVPTGYAKGTAKVPGKGSPTKDSVPAMLAPGEAVLNQPAAEGLGRGLIALLNSVGQQKMGMA